jgi:hypothetical protein
VDGSVRPTRHGDFFVVDTTPGEEVLLVDSPDGDYSWGTLSSDGRFLKLNVSELAIEQGGGSGAFSVYVVDAGTGQCRQSPAPTKVGRNAEVRLGWPHLRELTLTTPRGRLRAAA